LESHDSRRVDCAVSAPPLGMKLNLPHPYELLDGTLTQEADFAAVDLLLRHLADGGRAVIQVATGFTFRRTGERFRQYLANHYRIAALIGCPPGSVPDSSVASTIMVIENSQPTETLIVQLAEDWETQLAPGGAALEAVLDHIDYRGSGS
jgi:type I restriction-modification system DNA methylase subunit